MTALDSQDIRRRATTTIESPQLVLANVTIASYETVYLMLNLTRSTFVVCIYFHQEVGDATFNAVTMLYCCQSSDSIVYIRVKRNDF